MATFVLILTIVGPADRTAIATAEYGNKTACMEAAARYKSEMDRNGVNTVAICTVKTKQ